MRVTLLQMALTWGSAEDNRQRAEQLMDEAAPGSALYVLPEMWATGFVMQPEAYAEFEQCSPSLDWMRRQAARRQAAVCGSLAVRATDGSYRNRHYFVTPDGACRYYDKHHLFTYGHEHQHYSAGQAPVVVEWQGFRLLLLTCYDLRFPVFSRYGRKDGAGEYDAIVCVANWPAKRQLAWDTLVRARAIENQCYMVAVNRVGDDPACHYAGGSVVVDPVGRAIAEAPLDATCSVAAVLDKQQLLAMRQHFRVLDDRD